MTRTSTVVGKILGLAATLLLIAPSAQAATIYDNTATNRNLIFPVGIYTVGGQTNISVTEIGDQVTLGGTARLITDMFVGISLASSSTNRNETAKLKIYEDNASGTPTTLLFSSGAQSLSVGFFEYSFQGIGAYLGGSSTVTWMVEFAGVETGETAGLAIFGNPTVGQTFDDIWVRAIVSGTPTFELKNLPTAFQPEGFYAKIIAVPEPSTYALLILAGISLVAFRQVARRRNA